ncbi:PadR family transcriptional regulator [Cuneatibacter sp. NSJ-177]|uniref:PadR family transcriptional regulator n=1 Tax=Cuneatibacter sp. NSJ-177 TaxID=2931401 RepID=UPI001FCFE238|nr:PadR family transcriptional regulator [Cuneatibacter sp. NSJ-177]MCJ7836320.1 PadR family transcriptional regulator [Cuneatibacter sp. NSJ-177]
MKQKCACKGFFLDKLIQPAILLLLKDNPTHGFQLLTELTENEMIACDHPDPTGLYRTLKKMEQDGLLSSHEEEGEKGNPRRIYALTEEGDECLANWRQTLISYRKNIDVLLNAMEQRLPEKNPVSCSCCRER